MLTDRERRELEIIERELNSDPRFAASFARASARRFPRQLVRPPSVIAFGGLVLMAGVLLGLTETFMQGLVLTALGVTWWAWTTRTPPPEGQGRTTSPRR